MDKPTRLYVYITLMIALLFQLFPWTGQGIILRPDFMLVVLLYWLLRAPYLCNIATAWVVGLLMDLSTGSLLGQHALAFTLTAFIALSFQKRLVLFSAMQIVSYVFALLVFTRFTLLILKLFAGHEAPSWHYFWPAVTSIILWQFLRLVLGSIARPKAGKAD